MNKCVVLEWKNIALTAIYKVLAIPLLTLTQILLFFSIIIEQTEPDTFPQETSKSYKSNCNLISNLSQR